jgi:hypothetical protein
MARTVHRGASIAAAGLMAALPLGWGISDRLESDDRFCLSCHLAPEAPLHERIFAEYATRPPANLASAHAAAAGGASFRCIDCHGGTGLVGRARVKLVSVRDALYYALGAFEEPQGMRHPLWDEDCAKCHETYDPPPQGAFHDLEAHNLDFPYACVECHRAHPVFDLRLPPFLSRDVVLPVCRNCHEEF